MSFHGNSRNKIILEALHLRQCSKIFSETRGFYTCLKQFRFPAEQNRTVRFARKIYRAFCWIICTQVKEGKNFDCIKTALNWGQDVAYRPIPRSCITSRISSRILGSSIVGGTKTSVSIASRRIILRRIFPERVLGKRLTIPDCRK